MVPSRPDHAGSSVLAVSDSEEGCIARLTTTQLILQNCGQFLDIMTDLADRRPAPDVILDMSGVELIDNAAALALARAFKVVIRGGGSLELAAVRPQVSQMLAVARLDGIIGIREQVPGGA